MDEHKPKTANYTYRYSSGIGYGFPLLIIFIGAYWLARNQGWIPETITFWPVLLIGFGLWLLWKQLTWRY